MPQYLFTGTVLPEHAQITATWEVRAFTHLSTGSAGRAQVRILLNQVAAWIETAHVWDIFDLRNVVRNILQSHLSMIGFIRGYAYELEITRVICAEESVDHVFGIDIPCISDRGTGSDLQAELDRLRPLTAGLLGIFVNRCFSDLVSAMKHADDTAFYCYRAIESLRHHMAGRYGLQDADRASQWAKFRELSQSSEIVLRELKAAADPLRHGNNADVSPLDRAATLTTTWKIVDAYLNAA